MANDEHLRILLQGVVAWNEWRRGNNKVKVDIKRAPLSGADLSGADLNGIYLHEANLRGANLRGVNLKGANLKGANLRSAFLNNANLRGANLTDATLLDSDLTGANLNRARLARAEFNTAFLINASLIGANLIFTDLSYTDLLGANLSKAKLTGTNFTGANLAGVNVTSAEFLRTLFVDIDLSAVIGLENIKHRGPSEISISTIFRSEGKIPENFLRGCGVPDEFITQIPALVAAIRPIQFHSCFISYSSKDEEFARRLHERMRAAGLRVWFAPEDIRGGEKLYEQIDRAIQVHDRLLLVLSEHSMRSEWVMTELRRARKAEVKEEGRRKLFPIRLVDYNTLGEWECFDADQGKDLAVEVREYFIPDFSNWKSHDHFEAAFKRLLADLKASV
jgi:hypothetical protein